jgi:hypothetical protein
MARPEVAMVSTVQDNLNFGGAKGARTRVYVQLLRSCRAARRISDH